MRRKFALLVLSTLIISVFAFTLSSCGGGGSKEKPSPSGSSVTPSVSGLNITAGGSGTLTISATANWTATASSSEVKVSPNKGSKGTTTVTISLASGATKNSYTVTFKCGSNSSTVTITKGGGSSSITVTPTEVVINAEAGTGTATITCSGNWTISTANKPDWVSDVKPTSGQGNGSVTITTKANTERVTKSYIMEVSSGSYKANIVVVKKAAENKAPTKPTNLAPTGSNIDRFPELSWTASTDPDSDEIKYTIQYSKDNSTWTTLDAKTATKYIPKKSFDANTTYYWKVVASDGYTNGKTESDVASFTTGTAKKYYDDCEVSVYQTGTVAKPVVLIFTGDGYTQELHQYGGQWDQEMNKGIEALFTIEPYKTYRNYFTIYKIAAYSNEVGMSSGSSDWDKATNKVDTRFKCSWEGGNSTSIGCDAGLVIDVVQNVPSVDASTFETIVNSLSWSPISILINTNEYAGTNSFIRGFNTSSGTFWLGGFGILSIAKTPARHPAGSGYGDSWNTLRHEFGGHGFGLLGDEYVYYQETIPTSAITNCESWKEDSPIGCYGNITFKNDPAQCEWAQFIGLEGYEQAQIGLYAGAMMYAQGVWRSEYISCMWDNRPHYNTQSRWQIYRRIKITAGETPTLEDFVAHDVDRWDTTSSSAPATKSNVYRRHTPPMQYDIYYLKNR